MDNTTRARVVRIGNSRGVRIPKFLLEQTGIGDEVVLEAEGDHIIIRPSRRRREGWEAFSERLAGQEEHRLLDAEVPTPWDEHEWDW